MIEPNTRPMKKLLSLALVAGLLFACNSPESVEKDRFANDELVSDVHEEAPEDFFLDQHEIPEFDEEAFNMKDLYKALDKRAERFTIRADRDTTLTCKEGTTLKIDANSFVNKRTGEPITGSVTVRVKEYYQMDDILNSGLHTMSSTGILETGGMLYVDAKANGRSAKLAKGKPMAIGMPYDTEKEGMRLFNGKMRNGEMVWVPAEPPAPAPAPPVITEDVLDEIEHTEIVPDYPEDEIIELVEEPEEVVNSDEQLFVIVEEMPQFPGGEAELMRYLGQNVRYPQLAREMGISGRVYARFVVNKDGSIGDVTILRGIHPSCDNEVIRVLQGMPKWSPGKQRGKAVPVQYTIPVRFGLRGGGYRYETNDVEYAEEFESTTTDENLEEKTTDDIQRYVFSTTEMGWINCDRWSRETGPKVAVTLNIDKSIPADAKLVFQDERIIMPVSNNQGVLSFLNVPVGKKAKLVAFKYEDGKTWMSVSDVVVRQNSAPIDVAFAAVTMAELKAATRELKGFSSPI